MKCPYCGNFLENSVHRALKPYQKRSAVVITNLDYVIEIGDRIQCIIEEKHSENKVIRGYQLITLRKIAKSLNVPLYVLFSKNGIELYEFPVNEVVRTSPGFPYVSFEDRDPVLSGTIEDLGSWFFENYLSHAPLSRVERRKKEAEVFER